MQASTQSPDGTCLAGEDIYILASFHVAQTSRSRAMILKIPHKPDADAVSNMSHLRYLLVSAAQELFPDIHYATQITSAKIQWHVALPPPPAVMAELLARTNSVTPTTVSDGAGQDQARTISTGVGAVHQASLSGARQPAAAAVETAVVEPLEMLYLEDAQAWTQIMGIARRGSRDVLEVTISAVQRRDGQSTS